MSAEAADGWVELADLANAIADQRDAVADRLRAAKAECDDLRARNDRLAEALETAELRLADAPTEHEALAAQAERAPWWVLRAASVLIRGHWSFDGIDSKRMESLADELEREHRRDRLIEQAAAVIATEIPASEAAQEDAARALVDAGLLVEAVDPWRNS